MSERTTTYSTNPDDYEYDSSIYHLRTIPGVGTYEFRNDATEQQIQAESDRLSLTSELQYANLHEDTALLNSFKRYYKRKNEEDFTGTDQEAIDEFMSEFAYIDNNLTLGLGRTIIDQRNLSEQDKLDVGLLFDRYDRTNATGEGSRDFTDQLVDVGKAVVTDPLNFIGVFTGGAGFIARGALGKVASQTTKEALINRFRNSIAGKYGQVVAKYPKTTGIIQGAGWASVYDIEKQNLEIDSGIRGARHVVTGEQESFNYDELLTTAVVGAGIGGTVGLGAQALSKFFSKGSYSKILGKDRTKSTTEELRQEATDRNIPVESDPIIIDNKEIDKVNKKFNTTQEKIDGATEEGRQLPLPLPASGAKPTKTPEHSYPLNWVNDEGETINVTVSNKTVSRASPDSPEVTEVTLRDKDGKEYTTITNDAGEIQSTVSRFTSDDGLRMRLDAQDITEEKIQRGTEPMKWAHNFLQRHFTSHFGLGPETAERIRDAERNLVSSGEKIDILIKRFEKEWEKRFKTSFNEAGRDTHYALIKALTSKDISKITIATDNQEPALLLPKGSELHDIITDWKNTIAESSKDLLKSNAFTKYKLKANGEMELDEAGNPIENTFFKTLEKNEREKTYLHRMYSLYEDQDYANKALTERLGEKDYNEIQEYFMNKFGMDRDSASQIMEEIATPSINKPLGAKGPLAKRSIKIKGDDKQYVTRLLGEITDPRQLFAATVFKTKKLTEDYKLKRDLVSNGLRRGTTQSMLMAKGARKGWVSIEKDARAFTLKEDQLNRMWSNQSDRIADELPAPFMDNPFDNIFVDPEYKKYYNAMYDFYNTDVNSFQRILAGSTFAFNVSHTVLSPTTHTRNLSGGMLQNAYNAILPFSSRAWRNAVGSGTNIEGSPTYSIFRRTLPMFNKFRKRGELDDGDVESITRLIELGVLHNSLRSGLFKEAYNIMIKSANPLHHLEQKLIGARQKGTKATAVVDKLAEVYEMSDNINKISAFESEFGWLFRAFGDGNNTDEFIKHADVLGVFNARQRLAQGGNLSRLIEEAAAKKVNMFTPTYSQLTGASRPFRKYPIGNFVAFAMEVTRNYANSWRLASRELRSGSAAMRTRGGLRAAALAGASGITVGGIGGFSAALNGLTDEQRDALEDKAMLPVYEHGTNFWYPGKLKDNKIKVIPLAYTDPFSYLSRIAQVAMHSFQENENDAVLNSRLINASWESFKAAMDPYVIPAVGPETLWNTYSELSKAAVDNKDINIDLILKGLNTAFTPTFIKDIYKADLIPFVDRPKQTSWGTEVDPMWHTLLAFGTGMKPKTIDIPSRVGFALATAHREQSANSSEFGKYIGTSHNWLDPDYRSNIANEYKKYLKKEKEIARKVRRLVKNGYTLGLDDRTIHDLATKFSKTVADRRAGPQKYKANFSGNYMGFIYRNKYPIEWLSAERERKITDSLQHYKGIRGGDNLMTDLYEIMKQENINNQMEDE